jgi:hypothetical protein
LADEKNLCAEWRQKFIRRPEWEHWEHNVLTQIIKPKSLRPYLLNDCRLKLYARGQKVLKMNQKINSDVYDTT